MQTYERRPHARRASTNSLPVYSTTSMSMSMMNLGAGGTVHRRTGSEGPPAWKPVLKSRPQSFQVAPRLAANTSLSSNNGDGGNSPDLAATAAYLAGPVVQRISAASIGVPKVQHHVISPILTHSGHGPTSIFEAHNASTRPPPTRSTTSPPSSFPSSSNMSTPPLQYARQSILQPRRASLNSTRRESRPLRSSPLAGPSLGVGTDGTLAGEGSEDNEKPRYRPGRISSTPDVAAAFAALKEARAADAMTEEKRKSRSAPTSPAGTLSGGVALPACPTSLVRDVADPQGQGQVQTAAPTLPQPARQSRRLSLGFRRISALPNLPSFSHKKSPSNDSNVEKHADVRRHVDEFDTLPQSRHRHQHQEQRALTMPSPNTAAGRRGSRDGRFSEDVPPVPAIPDWARSLTPSSPTNTTFSTSTARDASYTPAMRRRPATAPSTLSPSFVPSPPSPTSTSTSTAAMKKNHRRSRQTVVSSSFSSPTSSSFAAVPPSPTRTAPNTSTDPDANWMSAASVPRFSRLGVVAGSVVMPVSAKEAEKRRKRQSAVSLVAVSGSGGGGVGAQEGARGENENGNGHAYEYEYASGSGSMRSRAPSIRSLSSVKTVQKEKREDKERGKGKEREKLVSEETAQRMRDALEAAAQGMVQEESVTPPSPAFLRNTSSTSLATSSGSTGTGTSVCSVGSIGTVVSIASVRTVATTASVSSSTTVSEGLRTPQTSFDGVKPVGISGGEERKGVEVRVNDVTVEIIDVVPPPVPTNVRGAGEGKTAGGKTAAVVEKSGPLRRMWKKVIGRA